MLRRSALWAALTVVGASCPGASLAQSVDWSGIWRFDSCDSGTESWVIGAGGELVINEAEYTTGPILISDAPVVGNWHSLETQDGLVFYVGMTEAHELIFLDLKEGAVDQFSEEVDSGDVTPMTHRDIWEETIYQSCSTLPPASRLLFGELTSVMLGLNKGFRACSADMDAEDCIGHIVDALDLTYDGELSRAELARILRAGALYAGGQTDWVQIGDATVQSLSVLPFAPVVASILLGSYDYDSSGGLDAAEIAADRFALTLSEDLASALPDQSSLGQILDQRIAEIMPFLMELATK